jgi:SAM-dependent methyltransferase
MTAASPDVAAALARVLGALAPARDILEGRVDAVEPPGWCVWRGWAGFLLAIDDAELARCEAEGLGARVRAIAGAPEELIALADEVREATRLPALAEDARAIEAAKLRAVRARKQEQLPALLGAVGAMAERAERIVDVGAGSGHFTRLAAEMFERETVGVERDRDRVAAAERRAAESGGAVRFEAKDVTAEPLVLLPGDLAVGLHACGSLGDQLVLAAASAGCDVALVSCCAQKIAGDVRPPLSRAAQGFTLRRDVLGLANLTSQAHGVEVSIEETMAAREARWALGELLRARGVEIEPGQEMRGINRRRARLGLAEIAARALAQRGLAPATEAEIRHHETVARLSHGIVRRLSLPRSMLARAVEAAIVLDRAAALEEHGHAARVATMCARAVTPRNIALFASRTPDRLPRIIA